MSKLINGYHKFQVKNINIIEEIEKKHEKKAEGTIKNLKYQIYRNKKYKERFKSLDNTCVVYVEAESVSDEELELLLDYYMPRRYPKNKLTYNLVRTIYLIINSNKLNDSLRGLLYQSIEVPDTYELKVFGNVIIPAIYCKEKQELCVGYNHDGFVSLLGDNFYKYMCNYLYAIFDINDKKKCKNYMLIQEKRKKKIYHYYSINSESNLLEILFGCIFCSLGLSWIFFYNYFFVSFFILLAVFVAIYNSEIKECLDTNKYIDKILTENNDETQFIDKIVSTFIPKSKDNYVSGKESIHILNQEYNVNLFNTKYNYVICLNYDTLKKLIKEKNIDDNTLIMYFNNDSYLHIYNDNLKLKKKFLKIVTKQIYNNQDKENKKSQI